MHMLTIELFYFLKDKNTKEMIDTFNVWEYSISK